MGIFRVVGDLCSFRAESVQLLSTLSLTRIDVNVSGS